MTRLANELEEQARFSGENRARRIQEERPWLVVGSPMRKALSILIAFNKESVGEERFRTLRVEALVRVECCCQLYRDQVEAGRYFLHEHPVGASSWNLPCVRKVMGLPGVQKIIGHMCYHGMQWNTLR